MIGKGYKKGTTRFSVRLADPAKKVVQLAGDFKDWKPIRMRRLKGGEYVANVALAPGTYEYKFIVAGEWITDPDNEALKPNDMGTMNSVAVVP
jgi:1,4-alpha-glucan branching enzyme